MITIRPAVPADADEILEVHVGSIRGVCSSRYSAADIEAWAGPKHAGLYLQAMETVTMLVAVHDGKVIGFGDFDREGTIRGLYIRPDHIGAGIGRKLLDALEADALDRGVTELQLHASLNAVSFYERAGYARLGMEELELTGGAMIAGERMTKSLVRPVRPVR